MTAALLCLACAAELAYICRLIALDGHTRSRAPLPRHAGQTRPVSPVTVPDEGPSPGGTSLAPQTPLAREIPLPVETPVLYRTDALPLLSLHDEDWWDG